MKNLLRVGIANLVGFVAAILFLLLLLEGTQQEGGYLHSYADWLANALSAWYGPVQFSVLFGAACALIVSFIVSHIVEKFLARKGKAIDEKIL